MIRNFNFVCNDQMLAGAAYPKTAEDIEILYYTHKIRAIVSFEPIDDLPAVIDRIKSFGIRHLTLPIADGQEPEPEIIEPFLQFVDQCMAAKLSVLLHCKAGHGRTGTMLMVYLMARYGYTLSQAYNATSHLVITTDQINFLEDYAIRLDKFK